MLEKIALKKNLISESDYKKAVNACSSSENFENALKDYFITHNLIPFKTLEHLISSIGAIKILKRNIRFGGIAVEMGFLNHQVLEIALEQQKQDIENKKTPKLIGEILIESGFLIKEQVRLIIQEKEKQAYTVVPVNKKVSSKKKTDPGKNVRKASKTKKIQEGMLLDIEDNGMSAFLQKTVDFNYLITAEDIRSILLSENIQYGIKDDLAIEAFINSSLFVNSRFKIASGSPIVQGKDATIEYYFDTDYLMAGDVDEQGNIDFKNRGEIPVIDEKTLIAEKFPFKLPENGKDVFNNELLSEPIVDMPLKTRTGAILSEDEMKLYSKISGHPKLSWSGNINVLDTILVEGDVGYETGHINFEGNIDIQGRLKNGFRVDGVDITLGEVDGGQIHAQGDVTVVNGINNATIYSRGHVFAKYIHNSEINCLGNLSVEKEIVDTNIVSSGLCKIESGGIVNSTVYFYQGVYAKNIGTEKTNANTIGIGQDLFVSNELKTIEKDIIELEKTRLLLEEKKDELLSDSKDYYNTTSQIAHELDKIIEDRQSMEKQLASLENHPEEGGQISHLKSELKQKKKLFSRLDKELNERFNVSERNDAKIKEIDTDYDNLDDQIDDLNQEKSNFTNWSTCNIGKPVITVADRIFSGTLIKSAHCKKRIDETIRNVRIEETIHQQSARDSNIYEIKIDDNIRKR